MTADEAENSPALIPVRQLGIIHIEDEPVRNSGFARELGPLLEEALSDLNLVLVDMEDDDESDLKIVLVYQYEGREEYLHIVYRFAETGVDLTKVAEEVADLEIAAVIFDVFVGTPSEGIALYRAIESRWQTAEHIFYTAYPGTVVKDLAWNREDDRLFEKPLQIEQLLAFVVRCIRKRLTVGEQ